MHNLFLNKANWLSGKTILVSGATSGIGRALTVLLAKNDSKVIAHGRSQSQLNSLQASIPGNDLIKVIGDLKEEQGSLAVESIILDRQPNVLIINAGYNVRKEIASGWTDSEIHEMAQVNLISPIRCIRTFIGLPKLSASRRLAIILTTSCHFPRPKMSLYIAFKMGLMGFGKSLQQESIDLNVRTTLFYPGRTNTNFRRDLNVAYMKPESVAQTIISVLCLPTDVVPNEITFRPESDTFI